jgi:hypothetical protein
MTFFVRILTEGESFYSRASKASGKASKTFILTGETFSIPAIAKIKWRAVLAGQKPCQ